MVRRTEDKGAVRSRMVAKMAGGATMFAFKSKSDMLMVGERNVNACRDKLKELGIRLLEEDTGENYGRTVIFYPETGEFHIKAVGKDVKII